MTGTIQTYIDFSELRYFWIENDKITYVYIDNKFFQETYDYLRLRKFLSYHWKKFGVVASTETSKVFFICLNNFSSATSAGSILTVNFTTDSIDIRMFSTIDATNNKNYLNFVSVNYDITRIGKTAITVNTSQAEVIGSNYDTIQEAIDYISSNNLTATKYVSVDVYVGSESVTLKNGVDIYFKDGTKINHSTSGSNIFYDNNQAVTCSIYGDGVFTKDDSGCLLKVGTQASNINFGFKSATLTDTCFEMSSNVTVDRQLRVKGRFVECTGLVFGDGHYNDMCIDVLKAFVTIHGVGVQQSGPDGYIYLKNTELISTGTEICIYTDNTSGFGNDLFLIFVSIDSQSGTPLSAEVNYTHTYHVFHSRFLTDTSYYIFQDNPPASTTYIGYGNQNYSNKPASSNVYLLGVPITQTSSVPLAVGDITSTRSGAVVTIKIDAVAFADNYEVYAESTLIDTLNIDEFETTYNMAASSSPYRFKYRATRGASTGEFSRRTQQFYFGASVII